jgi:hypothetical protein
VNTPVACAGMDTSQLVRGLWEQLESTLKSASAVLERKEHEDRVERPNLELRAEGLAKFRDIVTKEKETYVDRFRAASGAPGVPGTAEAENSFWARIAELDAAIQKACHRTIGCVTV